MGPIFDFPGWRGNFHPKNQFFGANGFYYAICGKTKLFVCLPTPTIGEASAGEGLRLQPAQQACFSANINNIDLGLVRPGRFLGEVVLQKYDNDSRWINACIFNKSGVAGAVLQTALSLTD